MSSSIVVVSLLTLSGGDLKPVGEWPGVDPVILSGFRAKVVYEDASSRIGVWATRPATFRAPESTNEEVLQVLSGEAEITSENGKVLKVVAGDWVWVPGGSRFSWRYMEDFQEAYVYRDEGNPVRVRIEAPHDPTVLAHTTTAGSKSEKPNEQRTIPKIESTLRVTAPVLAPGAALPENSHVRTIFVINGRVTADGADQRPGSLFVIPASSKAQVKVPVKTQLLEVETRTPMP
jgi:uncharacterized cupin superfamily protein